MCVRPLSDEGPPDPETQYLGARGPGSRPSASAHPLGARTGAGPGVAPGPGAGLGSLCSRSADTWCPPARGPACPGREAAPGRPDRTGRDAGGAATSEPRRIPGRPAGGGEGGASQSLSGTASCRPPRATAGPGAGGLEHVTKGLHWGGARGSSGAPPMVPPPPPITHQTLQSDKARALWRSCPLPSLTLPG